jgi:hypothetical protein
MFSVDYLILCQIIEQFLYTGIFRAKVTPSRSQPRDGYIELHVREGIVQACSFITTQGQVYKWDQWETQLAQFGILNWELTPLQSSEPMPQVPSSTSSAHFQQSPAGEQKQSLAKTPRHAKILSSSQFSQLSKLYRQVYSLIDGRRQCTDIAIMLRKSQQEVDRIIDDLGKQGLIQL